MATITNTNTSFFSPTQISGCALWLDAADKSSVVTSGSTVTQWNDKSGNNNNTTARSGNSLLIQNAINGQPAISLTNTYFTGTFAVANTGFQVHCFAVATMNSSSGAFGRILSLGRPGVNDFNLTTTTFPFARDTNTSTIMIGRNSRYLSVPTPGYSTPFLVQSSHLSNIESIGVNGTLTPSSSNTLVATAFNITSYGVGTNTTTTDTNSFWNGYIGEIIVYTNFLTTTQRQQVEGYLAWKWNLQSNLPITHPFYTNPYITSVSIRPIANPYYQTTNYSLNPTTIDGCGLWLDAADINTITLSNNSVTQWRDKSSNNHICISNANYTGTSLPTFSNLNPPYVNLAPNQALVTNAIWNYTTAWSCFVCINTVSLDSRFLISPFNTVNIVLMSMNQGSNKIFSPGNGGFTSNIPVDITGRHIEYTSAENTNAISNLLYVRDGSLQASSVKNLNNNANSNRRMGIGANATFSSLMGGTYQLYEVLIYNRFIDPIERQQIEGYLAWKWNLQSNLPTTHPFYRNPFIANLSIPTPIPQVITLTNVYPFLPTQYNGCALWLDAADTSRMTLSGSNISHYRDKSANQIILSNSTQANQPTLVTDTNNMLNIEFNGTTQFLTNSSVAASNLTLNNEVTLFFVHSPTNSQNSLFTWGNSAISGGIPRINVHTPEITTNYRFDYNNFTTGRITAVVPNYLTSGRRLDGGFKRGTTQVLRSYGTTLASRIDTNTITGSTTLPLTVGWFLNLGGYYYRGRLCELVWYNRGLSDTEINQVEGYLSWKWGLQKSLPTNHPFYLFPPG